MNDIVTLWFTGHAIIGSIIAFAVIGTIFVCVACIVFGLIGYTFERILEKREERKHKNKEEN